MPDREPIELSAESSSAERQGYTPLRPTIWMTGVLVWATVIALFLKVPTWAGIFLCLLTGSSFLLYFGSYIYLMAIDREALKSERYSVKRLPSQRSLQVQVPSELLAGDPLPLAELKTPLSSETGVVLTKDEARSK